MSFLSASRHQMPRLCASRSAGRQLGSAIRQSASHSSRTFSTSPAFRTARDLTSREDRLLVSSKPKSRSNPTLADIISDAIEATGPMPVARYMQLCLTHPELGYYSQGDVFGKKGDFITSPEISQIFGELVAIWLLTRWMAAGSPSRCRIIELGPGRGTLMDDVLRTLSALGKLPVESVHLVEASEKMRDVQKEKLASRVESLGATLNWADRVDSIQPEEGVFTMAIAHEFFDALPIHILQRTDDGFREVRVAKNPSYLPAANNARFALALDRESSLLASLLPAASQRYRNLPIGSRMEISPDSSHIVRALGTTMQHGGVGLVVDYGGDQSFSNSFRAFRNHNIVDVFDKPGASDLTANVDFAYLKESLQGTAVPFGPMTQSKFLLSMGLEPRLQKLLASAPDEATKERIQKGAKRLIDNLGMGSQYQVMAFGTGAAAEGEVYPFPAVETPKAKAEPKVEESKTSSDKA